MEHKAKETKARIAEVDNQDPQLFMIKALYETILLNRDGWY